MCSKDSDYNRQIHQYYRAQCNTAAIDCQLAEQIAEVLTGYSTKTIGPQFKRPQLASFKAEAEKAHGFSLSCCEMRET